MEDYLIRFISGGLIVSLFAAASDLLRPKSFAGLFGAAPSVGIVTLTLALWDHGAKYVAVEARSMMLGAVALACYSFAVMQILKRNEMSALAATIAGLGVWAVVAFGLLPLVER